MNQTNFSVFPALHDPGSSRRPLPAYRRLPYRLAVPLIIVLSLGLWVVAWKLSAVAVLALLGE